MNQEFMKKKPILPLVISMALPMTISMLVNALYNIVDGYFVAKISEDAMTGTFTCISVAECAYCNYRGFWYRNQCRSGILPGCQ